MTDVFLSGIQTLCVERDNKKIPRERFIRYYEDLYSLYNKKLDHETFYQGGQYSFSELGELILNHCQKKDWLRNLNLFITTYWSHEFDPDYSNCVSYFQERFSLNCNSFDMNAIGTLGLFSALRVVKILLSKNINQKAILLALEQNTIPRHLNDKTIVPLQNRASALLLTSHQPNEHSAFKLIDSMIVDSDKMIMELLSKNNSTTILLRQNSPLEKKLKKNVSHCQYQYFSCLASMLSPIFALTQWIHQSDEICIISEDVESHNIGILLLENVSKDVKMRD